MKYVVLLCDGMADNKIAGLSNKTPMETAQKPCMNTLAESSVLGLVRTVSPQLSPGSDVANLSVLGYDPLTYYTGRSPLEAASMGITLLDTDLAIRANLVTLSDEEDYNNKTLADYCADDISSKDAKILIDYINENLKASDFELFAGVSYRHCLVWHNGSVEETLTPPHDITGKKIAAYTGGHKLQPKLYDFMLKSHELLKNHPLNRERVLKGKRPANSLWFWGQGKKPRLESFYKKFGLKGSIISAVDLLKGIGICAEMNVPDVKGATGYIDTDFSAKAAAALNELASGQDFVYIHIEAPDECGHRGELNNKIKSIELIDRLTLKPLLDGVSGLKGLLDYDNFRLLILPDHPTPLCIKTHSNEPVPFMLYEKNNLKALRKDCNFCESTCTQSGIFIEKGHTLMNTFLSTSPFKL